MQFKSQAYGYLVLVLKAKFNQIHSLKEQFMDTVPRQLFSYWLAWGSIDVDKITDAPIYKNNLRCNLNI
jgi:hypothetical protein